jgi:hypothetical protein
VSGQGGGQGCLYMWVDSHVCLILTAIAADLILVILLLLEGWQISPPCLHPSWPTDSVLHTGATRQSPPPMQKVLKICVQLPSALEPSVRSLSWHSWPSLPLQHHSAFLSARSCLLSSSLANPSILHHLPPPGSLPQLQAHHILPGSWPLPLCQSVFRPLSLGVELKLVYVIGLQIPWWGTHVFALSRVPLAPEVVPV